MYIVRLHSFLIAAYVLLSVALLVSSKSSDDKNSKAFSLFSVVTFPNAECTSDTSFTGGATAGTCYTTTECSDKGGTKSGNCASGFGVCCVIVDATGKTATITNNRTRLRNSEFPTYATSVAAESIVYTINKMSSDICQIRLDFTTFVIGGPGNTVENIVVGAGTHCVDKLTVTSSAVTNLLETHTNTLCGALTGEHLYVELSPTAADTATVTIATVVTGTMTPAVAQRMWDIKTSQIECHATYRAPLGCDRYMTESTGKIISYNFYKVKGTTQLAAAQNSGVELTLQRVNTCIRRAKHMCCVEYSVCSMYNAESMVDVTNGGANNDGTAGVWNEAFSIDLDTSPFIIAIVETNCGLVDAQCTGDYVEIPSSWSASCGSGTGSARGTINTRYCGARFGAQGAQGAATAGSTPVCDCSEPFIVRHSSDDVTDLGGMDEAANDNNNNLIAEYPRGFCLDYRQTPCWQ